MVMAVVRNLKYDVDEGVERPLRHGFEIGLDVKCQFVYAAIVMAVACDEEVADATVPVGLALVGLDPTAVIAHL